MQQRHLQRLLAQVWRRSPFYREYYAGHGIREECLRDVSVADLPLLPRKMLIDNFDRAVTDARLRRTDVEAWLHHNRNPRDNFCSDTIVLHGSGTSGDLGIFAYDHKAWTIADLTLAAHLPLPENLAAWNAPIYMLYASAESKFMAIRTPGSDQMTVLDDLNILEVLEVLDERDQPVAPEQEGRVVLTNLYNVVLPIIRYELGDYVRRGTPPADAPFTTLREIRGRVHDALPVVLADGKRDTIHPLVLDIQVPTVDKVQYVSSVRITFASTMWPRRIWNRPSGSRSITSFAKRAPREPSSMSDESPRLPTIPTPASSAW